MLPHCITKPALKTIRLLIGQAEAYAAASSLPHQSFEPLMLPRGPRVEEDATKKRRYFGCLDGNEIANCAIAFNFTVYYFSFFLQNICLLDLAGS